MLDNPAQSLLIEHLSPTKDSRIIALEGGDGRMIEKVARLVPFGDVLTLARDLREVNSAKILLAEIENANVGFDVFPSNAGWDIVLLVIPKGRRYAKTLLIAAWQALRPGGKLLMSGPTRKGAKAVIKDAENLFGNVRILGYRSHNRIAVCIRGDSLFHPLPEGFQQGGIAPGTTHSIDVPTKQGTISVDTHPGIFSWDGIDEGTQLLLENLIVYPGDCVWDVGCGYGIIGLTAAKLGASKVLMTDINLIATEYANRNIRKNNLSEIVTVIPAAGLSPEIVPHHAPPYDLIVSNPAFHQGHNIDTSMAQGILISAPEILSPNGRLLLVANRFLNYHQNMQNNFKKVVRLAETNKYHVIEAHN